MRNSTTALEWFKTAPGLEWCCCFKGPDLHISCLKDLQGVSGACIGRWSFHDRFNVTGIQGLILLPPPRPARPLLRACWAPGWLRWRECSTFNTMPFGIIKPSVCLEEQMRDEAGGTVELVNWDILAWAECRPWCRETTDTKKNWEGSCVCNCQGLQNCNFVKPAK